jgi:hypothetical protein
MATTMAMADGNGNGDGRLQLATAMATATATATELATATEMGAAMALAMATARVTITKEGLPVHVAAICSARHLASTPMDTNESACVMGVTLLRVFAPLQGGGFLTAHYGLFFVYFLQLLFSLLNNPLFTPPHYSGAQEPSQPIDALPPPLLQDPHQPIDDLPRLLLQIWSRYARAGLAIIIT